MWGIKLESLLSPIDLSYLQILLAQVQPPLPYRRPYWTPRWRENGDKISKNMKYVMWGIKLESLLSPIVILRCNLTYTVKVLFDGMSPLIKTHFLDGFSFSGMFLLEKCVKGGGIR